MSLNKTIKKLNLENEVEEVVIEEPATIEDVVEKDITNSEFQETSKDLEDAIETSDELDEVGSEVQEELDAVNDRLESEEPIDPVDVTVVNESIQHYSKLLGLTRESVNLSLEDVRNNTRESMEGLKVELEGIGEKIKEFGKKVWAKIVALYNSFKEYFLNVIIKKKRSAHEKLLGTLNTLTSLDNDKKKDLEKEFNEKYLTTYPAIIDSINSNEIPMMINGFKRCVNMLDFNKILSDDLTAAAVGSRPFATVMNRDTLTAYILKNNDGKRRIETETMTITDTKPLALDINKAKELIKQYISLTATVKDIIPKVDTALKGFEKDVNDQTAMARLADVKINSIPIFQKIAQITIKMLTSIDGELFYISKKYAEAVIKASK